MSSLSRALELVSQIKGVAERNFHLLEELTRVTNTLAEHEQKLVEDAFDNLERIFEARMDALEAELELEAATDQ